MCDLLVEPNRHIAHAFLLHALPYVLPALLQLAQNRLQLLALLLTHIPTIHLLILLLLRAHGPRIHVARPPDEHLLVRRREARDAAHHRAVPVPRRELPARARARRARGGSSGCGPEGVVRGGGGDGDGGARRGHEEALLRLVDRVHARRRRARLVVVAAVVAVLVARMSRLSCLRIRLCMIGERRRRGHVEVGRAGGGRLGRGGDAVEGGGGGGGGGRERVGGEGAGDGEVVADVEDAAREGDALGAVLVFEAGDVGADVGERGFGAPVWFGEAVHGHYSKKGREGTSRERMGWLRICMEQ